MQRYGAKGGENLYEQATLGFGFTKRSKTKPQPGTSFGHSTDNNAI